MKRSESFVATDVFSFPLGSSSVSVCLVKRLKPCFKACWKWGSKWIESGVKVVVVPGLSRLEGWILEAGLWVLGFWA